MPTVVISQPMLFPWVGLFEQIRLSDYFVFYNDVQFSKGSFTNRVQLKLQDKQVWMTIPLKRFLLGDTINSICVSERENWREKHLNMLERCYSSAPYYKEMIDLVKNVYKNKTDKLSDLVCSSIMVVCDYYSLYSGNEFYWSSKLDVGGASSERVLEIVKLFKGDKYVTGHGAKNYLNHNLFEESNVRVEYMQYELKEYKQIVGDFTPYVSILDLIANYGQQGKQFIVSNAVYWKDFIYE